MMRLPRLKPGDVVGIKFHDHCEGSEILSFWCYGSVNAVDKKSIVIDTWKPADDDDDDHDGFNRHQFAILKSAIVECNKLVPAKKDR